MAGLGKQTHDHRVQRGCSVHNISALVIQLYIRLLKSSIDLILSAMKFRVGICLIFVATYLTPIYSGDFIAASMNSAKRLR